MNEEDKKIQKHLVDEMMKVSKTNPDVMYYMQALMEKYEQIEKENQKLNKIIDNAIDYIYKNSFDKEEHTKLWFRVFKKDLHGYAQKLLDILKKEAKQDE